MTQSSPTYNYNRAVIHDPDDVTSAVQRLLTAGAVVRVLVRDPGKAERLFGDSPHLDSIRTSLDDPAVAGLTRCDVSSEPPARCAS